VRSDKNLPAGFRDEAQWIVDPATGQKKPGFERMNLYGTEFHKHPYSGHERNKFFLNTAGKDFVDISGISGVDQIADSRTWVRWDFDRDGWQDIAVVNANKPLLSLFRNQCAAAGDISANGVIALRFAGGNHAATAAGKASARDGFGARVVVETESLRLEREHVCGEGYAAQNSATMLVGIGEATKATVTVNWPSGIVTGPFAVNSGTLTVCREIPGSEAPFVTSSYQDQNRAR